MNRNLQKFLDKIYSSGQEHDSKDNDHSTRMLNITPETGRYLSILLQSSNAKNVLEIGTSNGYSTIWLADAVSTTGGKVTTVEYSEAKHKIAVDNFTASGIGDLIFPILGDIRKFIKGLEKESMDFIFLDAERPQYREYWKELDRVLKKNHLLVADNALSPKPEEMTWIVNAIESSGRYLT